MHVLIDYIFNEKPLPCINPSPLWAVSIRGGDSQGKTSTAPEEEEKESR